MTAPGSARLDGCDLLATVAFMETLWKDIRFALRMLRKNMSVTVPAVMTLALGIGANAAIFSVVSAVLLRPLPYRDPERLVVVSEGFLAQDLEGLPSSYVEYLEFQQHGRVFEGWAAHDSSLANLVGQGTPLRVRVGQATASLFPLLGIGAERGRTFLPEEDEEGKNRVALLGQRFWKTQLGGDTSVLGKTITLDGAPFTVVGILPATFDFPTGTEVWTPFGFTAEQKSEPSRSTRSLKVLARLKPGVSLPQARVDLERVARDIQAQSGAYQPGARWALALDSLADATTGSVKATLLVLLAAVGLVLLIACGNVASLLLAQGSARQRELAIRAALGASRQRLITQLLTESTLLALLGGAAGLLLASWGVDSLLAVAPSTLPRAAEVRLDLGIVATTLGLSVLTSLVFGLLPALQSSRVNVHEVMTEGGRDTGSRASRGRAVLVVGEVALALVLLLGAGLLLRSFRELTRVNPGFQPAGVLTATVSLPNPQYADPARVATFVDETLRRVSGLPGVTAAGFTTMLPLTGRFDTSFEIENWTPPSGESFPDADLRLVTPDYFRALGASVVAGRGLQETDGPGAPFAVVVNQALARRYFPNEDPLGKRLKVGPTPWTPVVGVVADLREWGLDQPARPAMYFSLTQAPIFPRLGLAVRTTGEPTSLGNSLRREVAALDPELPLSDIATLEAVVERSVGARRFATELLGLFAVMALALAAVGVYGLVSFSVIRRTRELGIRMALGADAGQVVRLVLGQSLKLGLWGVGIGLLAGLALTRLMASLLYGVGTFDLWTIASVSALMMAVTILASAVPAWRATAVDPSLALRAE